MANPCQVDRLPDDLLRNVLHRAAVRLGLDMGVGVRALDERWSYPTLSSDARWAEVRELSRLRGVSKRFCHVASTVSNLHCRISPMDGEEEILRLANFLSKSKCAGALTLTLGFDTEEAEGEQAGDRLPETEVSIFNSLSESLCFEELFRQAPCLQRFAVVGGPFKPCKDLDEETAVSTEAASNRLLEALATNCRSLSALALGSSDDYYQRFPLLTSSLVLVCKPFSNLSRLCIHTNADIGSDGQGLTSLLKLCPNLLQLEVERSHPAFGQEAAAPDREYLLVESDSLEVLDVDVLQSHVTLDICTPKLLDLRFECESGAVVIAAPLLSVLYMDWSAKVTVLDPWEQLESLYLRSYSRDYVVWNVNGPLHEALQSCSRLKLLCVQRGWLKNLSGLTEGLGSLTELIVPDRWLCELRSSVVENLQEMRKLTVFFDHESLDSKSLDESPQILKGLRALEGFSKLEFLRLEDASNIAPCAVLTLLSLQKKRPGLDVQITVDPLIDY